MIAMLAVGDEFTPHVVCDVCRKPIRGEGNIEWHTDAAGTPVGPLLMAHKQCSRAIRRDGKRPDSWMPLGWFLGHLVENAQVDWKTTENFFWLPETHTALPQVRERQVAFPRELAAIAAGATGDDR